MAHDSQKFGAHPLELLQRRQVLHRDHSPLDRPVGGVDGRCVHECRHAPAVGNRERHLLGAQRLTSVQQLRHGEIRQSDLPAVGAPPSDDALQLFQGQPGLAQRRGDPARLPVEVDDLTAVAVEDYDAHGRDVDQRLQVGPRALLGAVGAGVGDRGGGLRREQRHDLLVSTRELPVPFLLADKEVADRNVAVPHRHGLHRPGAHQIRREAERPDVRRQIRQTKRRGKVTEVCEEP